jgi:hypothetical protein
MRRAILAALLKCTYFGAAEEFGRREDSVTLLRDAKFSMPMPIFPVTASFSTPPSVTIHTLTSEKRRHLDENLLRNWKRSTYPGQLTLMVYDQSASPSELLQKQTGKAPNRQIIYIFRNVTAEGMIVTGVSRNYMLSRTEGDVVVLMDSDDFYFPGYVSYMVEGLLSQKVLYFGLLGYYCTKMSSGKVGDPQVTKQ